MPYSNQARAEELFPSTRPFRVADVVLIFVAFLVATSGSFSSSLSKSSSSTRIVTESVAESLLLYQAMPNVRS